MNEEIKKVLQMRKLMSGEYPKKRNLVTSLFVLAKKQLTDILNSFSKKVFKVEIINERRFQEYLILISNKIDSLNGVIKNISFPTEIRFNEGKEIYNAIELLIESVNQLPKVFPEYPKIVLDYPKIQQITGNVKVLNQKEFPIQSILSALQTLENSIKSIRLEIPPQKEIKIPEFPTTISINESKAILKILKEVSDKLDELPKSFPEMDFPREIAVTNFPPQKYPMPVTHFSLNALNGFIKSRSVTVSSSLTPLPGEVLVNRRSLIIYNNSTQTVEVGGSTFTFGEGLPVPQNTYSPPLDVSKDTILYGRVTSGTADVRTLEISDEASGR